MSKKLSPWFPVSVKPARVGVYEVKQLDTRPRLMWDGKKWQKKRWRVSNDWGDKWRGLAYDPKGKA